jgi:predicted permease
MLTMILREARRFIRASPFLSLSGMLILAIGIGAAAFQLSLLLALSSTRYPGMHAMSFATIAQATESGGLERTTWKRFEAIRESKPEAMFLSVYSKPVSVVSKVGEERRTLRLAAVSGGFFSSLTPSMTAGRSFTQIETEGGNTHSVILRRSVANRLFGGPSEALGRMILLDGKGYQVVGVAPAHFKGIFGDVVDGWIPPPALLPLLTGEPLSSYPDPNVWKQVNSFYIIAGSKRLSTSGLIGLLNLVLSRHPDVEGHLRVAQGVTTDPARDSRLRSWLRLGLLLALAFTLVSGFNFSLLLLARTPRRIEEVRIRKALGANLHRLALELVSGPIAMVAGGLVCSFVLCLGGLACLTRIPGFLGQLVTGSWHTAVMSCILQTFVCLILSAIIALIPALHALKDNGAPGSRYTSTANRTTGVIFQGIIVAQITLCVLTWILSSMVVSSVLAQLMAPLGYRPSHLTVISLGQSSSTLAVTMNADSSFPSTSAILATIGRIKALPGVASAAFAEDVPLDGSQMNVVDVASMNASATLRSANTTFVGTNYFRTMGTRILQGRGFSPGIEAGRTNEIVMNEELAKELWPSGDPIGKTLRVINPAHSGLPTFTQVGTVVGVVENFDHSSATGTPEPTIFLCAYGSHFFDSGPFFVMRGNVSRRALTNAVNSQLSALMPGLKIESIYRLRDMVKESLSPDRYRTISALFAALLMAIISFMGLVGALTYHVASRRRELAVRICMGASRWDLRRSIFSRALICSICAVFVSACFWPVLAGLSSNEYLGRISWSTERAILVSLSCIAISAFVALIPAETAARIPPTEVLKEG